MPDSTMKLSESIAAKLAEIAKGMGGGSVDVGFIGGTEADGTPTASVAFWNEFGTTRRAGGPALPGEAAPRAQYVPPRPFFRPMVAAESSSWPAKMAEEAKATNYNGPQVLAIMGSEIAGKLTDSIFNAKVKPLAESTIARKGFSQPLVESGTMSTSPSFEVHA
jgi:hypothetical protein